ncbi:laccase domain-containing protein [Bacillus velezensis]|nr:laccase domain-containing protein [Bacillus velezensis]
MHVRDEAHDVVTNREVIASLCGTDLDSWVFADQTHENRVRRVTAGDKGKGARDYSSAFRGTDGLYTKDANLFWLFVLRTVCPCIFMTR